MIVLVTGGTRGIGRGIARAFAEAGHTVVVCGRKAPEAHEHAFIPADVRVWDDVERLIATVVDDHGRLDVLINNAGGSPAADTATASPRFSEAILRLNLLAPLLCAQAANARMQEHGGVIVNIASVAGQRAAPTTAAYGAAKAGLLNLTQTLAVEWAPKVRVNAVTPGLIATELEQAYDPSTIPMGRLGTPADVASACLWLASPAAAWVTGANLVVHGGKP